MALQITMPDYYLNKRNIARFPPNLDGGQLEEIKLYFRNHAISALSQGVSWNGNVEDLGWGAKTKFCEASRPDQEYTSIYVYRSQRGKGNMSTYIRTHPNENFCTAPSCDIEKYFKSKGVKYVVLTPCSLPEYAMVKQYYGDSVTDRTGIHMINHIDEGLFVLEQIGASELAKRAYILHPLVQGDPDLAAFWCSNGPETIDTRVLALALEYRNIANAHLSHHPSGLDAFCLSPLADVNAMLVADKVQNRKDFELYHLGSHPRSAALAAYFAEWLEKLGVTEQRYRELSTAIIGRTGGLDAAMTAKRPTDGPPAADEAQPGFNQVAAAVRAAGRSGKPPSVSAGRGWASYSSGGTGGMGLAVGAAAAGAAVGAAAAWLVMRRQ